MVQFPRTLMMSDVYDNCPVCDVIALGDDE